MTIDWLARAVPQSQALYPYTPGKPIDQMLREQGFDENQVQKLAAEVVKLASNENPYGPPPKAITAMQHAATQVHRYPDGDCFVLKQALAKVHGVASNQLLIGNGIHVNGGFRKGHMYRPDVYIQPF